MKWLNMQTLISAFDRPATARNAVERLVRSGFSREDVHLQEAPVAPTTSAEDADDRILGDRAMASAEREVAIDHDVLTGLSHFFGRLFGMGQHREHAGTYTEAVRRGNSLVVVDARDDDEAQRAATLLHDLGAINVDEHARQWQADGWTGTAAPQGTALAGQSIARPGVRVIRRESQPPLREIVTRDEQATGEPDEQAGRTNRE